MVASQDKPWDDRTLSSLPEDPAQLRLFAEGFSKTGLGIAVSSAETARFLAVNRAFAAQRGFEPDEIVGQPVSFIFPADRFAEAWRHVQAADATGHVTFESEHVRRDGSRFPVRLDVTVIRSPDGRPHTRFVAALDISETQAAARALQDSVMTLEASLGAMSDAVFIVDTEGRLVHFNDAFVTFHRFSRREDCLHTLAEYPAILEVYFPDGTPTPLDQWAVPRALRGESQIGVECGLRRRDTGESWVGNFNFSPIRDERGRVVGAVVTGRDVTEQKAAEEGRREQQELLFQMSDVARIAGWSLDPAGKTSGTAGLALILDFASGATIGMDTFAAMLVEDDRRRFAQAFEAALKEAQPFDLELCWQSRAGLQKWVRVIGRPLTQDGRVVKLRGALQDVTYRRQIESEVRRVSTRYRALVDDAAPDAIFVHDESGRFVEVNRRACESVGYARDELLKMTVLDLEVDFDIDRARSAWAAAQPGATSVLFGRHRRRDGSTFPVEVHVGVVLYEGKRLYIGFVRDISERRASEIALQESERRFHDIVAASADWIWEIDHEGRYTYVSDSVRDLLGYEAQAIIGRTPFDLMPPDEAERMHAELTSIMAERRAFRDLENTNVRKDGSLCYVQTTGLPIFDGNGELVGYRGLDRDVSQRKFAELELRERESRYREMFEANPQPMWVFDADSLRFLAVNDSAVRHYGYSRAEFLSMTIEQIRPPTDVPLVRPAVERIRDATGKTGVWRHRCKDGRQIQVDVTAGPINYAGRRAIVVQLNDVTARVMAESESRALNARLEQRVAERTAQLEQASRAKSDFLANMSHELRTPLNAIIGFSQLLKEGLAGELAAKQRDFVADIFDAGKHLLSLINDVLDLSKVEAGMLQLETEPTDFDQLLHSATLVIKEKAYAHHIDLRVDVDPGIGSVAVDPRKIKQIVFNLLSNAVKFTADGGAITLGARRCQHCDVRLDPSQPGRMLELPPCADSEFLEIFVTDTGVGIPEAQMSRLFEPFVQLDSSYSRQHSGTGLGLSLVRRLAELHGGTVSVSSHAGAGSRFSVWMPCRAPGTPVAD